MAEYVEMNRSAADIVALGYDTADVERVTRLLKVNEQGSAGRLRSARASPTAPSARTGAIRSPTAFVEPDERGVRRGKTAAGLRAGDRPVCRPGRCHRRTRQFVGQTRSMKAEFTQVVSGPPDPDCFRSLELSQLGKVPLDLQPPYPQLIVGDGQRLWVYDSDSSAGHVQSSTTRWAVVPPPCSPAATRSNATTA